MRNPSLIAREYVEKGRSDSCPIIDMHGHFGPWNTIYMPRTDARGMLESMDQAGVKALVCSAHEGIHGDPIKGNEIIREAILQHPGRFFGYWMINPNYPEVIADDLRRFPEEQGFLGFKFIADYHQYPLTGANYAPALAYAEEHGLCVLMHTWGYSPCDGPDLVRCLAEKYRRITFIMGHSGYGEWDASIEIVRDFGNVYLDLTSTYTTHAGIKLEWTGADFGVGVNGIIERMVEEVGSERLLFGTDLPWFSPHYAAGAVLFARISDADIHNIMHRNAEKIFAGQGITI